MSDTMGPNGQKSGRKQSPQSHSKFARLVLILMGIGALSFVLSFISLLIIPGPASTHEPISHSQKVVFNSLLGTGVGLILLSILILMILGQHNKTGTIQAQPEALTNKPVEAQALLTTKIPSARAQHFWRSVKIGVIILCFLNIALALAAMILGYSTFCPGDIAKISVKTAEPVQWGKFFPREHFSLKIVGTVPEEFSDAHWILSIPHHPETPIGIPIRLWYYQTDTPSPANVRWNIKIPDIKISEAVTLTVVIKTIGYTVYPIDNEYGYNIESMEFEPITLKIMPNNLSWLVHQFKWVPFSLGLLLLFGYLRAENKP